MELSSFLFSVILFVGGILLIFLIKGDLKEKRRREQRMLESPGRALHGARHISPIVQRNTTSNLRWRPALQKADSSHSSTSGSSKSGGSEIEHFRQP